MSIVTKHVHRQLKKPGVSNGRRWEFPGLLCTRKGKDFYIDSDECFWRALSYIGSSKVYEKVQGIDHAREAGYVLGKFQSLISDLDTGLLRDTLPGFHITPEYLRHYDEVTSRRKSRAISSRVKYCMDFVEDRRGSAGVLEKAIKEKELILRPIHGDPKIANILMDEKTGKGISIIDLDTVKPGLVHYDIGDCLRSCCNRAGEDARDFDSVSFDISLCRVILEGYLSVASDFLTENDYQYLFDAIRLIPYELGLRFFTDYMEGDVYFRTRYEDHNLSRALVQFKLTESIESSEVAIRKVIGDLR